MVISKSIYRRLKAIAVGPIIAIVVLLLSDSVDKWVEIESNHDNAVQLAPVLDDWLKEALRLNEFLAYTQYECKNSVRFPDHSNGFKVCLDLSNPNEKFNVLSISNYFGQYDFEKSIVQWRNCETLEVFTSKKQISDATSVLSVKVNPIEDGNWESVEQQLLEILSKSKANLLHLNSPNFEFNNDMPRFLDKAIKNGLLSKFPILLLTVRIKSAVASLLYDWYRILNRLFYDGNFVLYNAGQIGECGRVIRQCEYRLCFLRFPVENLQQRFLAPIAGLGFPEEEFSRLIANLDQDQILCPNLKEVPLFSYGVWKYCDMDIVKSKCTMVEFSVSAKFFISLHALNEMECDSFIFDPNFEKSFKRLPRVVFRPVGVWKTKSNTFAGFENAYSTSTKLWNVDTLDSVLLPLFDLNHTHIDILFIDLQGGEWDVLECLLKSDALSRIRQIVMRVHLWYGEENHNYRLLYTILYRLRSYGFYLYSKWYFITSESDERVHHCQEGTCVGLGWMKRKAS